MPADLKRKMNIGKGILILLILLYVGLSFTDCALSLRKVWDEGSNSYMYAPESGNDNVTWLLLACGALQVLLVLCNQYRLQMIPAIMAAMWGLVPPLMVAVNNLLAGNIYYFMEGPTYNKMQMTAMGYLAFVLAGLLLITSIVSAFRLSKLQKLIAAEEQNPAEREENLV